MLCERLGKLLLFAHWPSFSTGGIDGFNDSPADTMTDYNNVVVWFKFFANLRSLRLIRYCGHPLHRVLPHETL